MWKWSTIQDTTIFFQFGKKFNPWKRTTFWGQEERLRNRLGICEAIAERQFWTWRDWRVGFRCDFETTRYAQVRNPAVDDTAVAQISLSAAIVVCDLLKTKELLAKDLDVSAENEFFGRPLQLAVEWSSAEIVQQLLDAGADVHAFQTIPAVKFRWLDWPHGLYNSSCVSALEVACLAGREDIVRLLMRLEFGKEPSEEEYTRGAESAARPGYTGIVSLLMEKLYSGIIALPSNLPRRILLLATSNGHEEVVRMILRRRRKYFAYSTETRLPLPGCE